MFRGSDDPSNQWLGAVEGVASGATDREIAGRFFVFPGIEEGDMENYRERREARRIKLNRREKMRRKLLCFGITLALVLAALPLLATPVQAVGNTLYVDDSYTAAELDATHFLHPQDAVNAASPGDTILVYPGTYGSRRYTSPTPPHWSAPNDQYAPALIVYKDNLKIVADDPTPGATVIESTHNFWSNPVAVQASTGGTWNGSAYVGAGVYPANGTAPNACAIVASDVTIDGFTFHRHFEGTWATYNTAGVMIGGLFSGDTQFPGHANDNTVQNCVFGDVWHAVYIWHSSGNTIVNNTVAALNTDHWAAISTYDGYDDTQIGLGNPSENNLIAHNTIANKGIALGAWAPLTWTSNAGSRVCYNTCTQVGVTYSHGPVLVCCNTGGFWQSNTDKVIRIKGITYTGDTVSPGLVNLSAQLNYDGSADGSGVEVIFSVGGSDYSATTLAGGVATTSANLPIGAYTVETKVIVCDCCQFTDTDLFYVSQPTQFVIWGGNFGGVQMGQDYVFWGAQWAKQVKAGDFKGNPSFKGYADTVTGTTWTTKPGNSKPPTGVPNYISVIVATHIAKNGSVISGNIFEMVILRVDDPASYQPDPGHPGSGVVVAIIP
jgi:parallel beta-helix repeat protein